MEFVKNNRVLDENFLRQAEAEETTTEIKVRRKRRTKEEIEADRRAAEAEKAQKAAAREAAKAEKQRAKEEAKAEKEASKADKAAAKAAATKRGNGQTVVQPDGGWNDPSSSISLEEIKVEIRLMDQSLGLNPSDKNLLSTYIASKAPDAPSKAEEIAAYGEDAMEKKATTIFPRGYFQRSDDGEHLIDCLWRKGGGRGHVDTEVDEKHPFFWNYQLRGFFKDSCGLLIKGAYGKSAEVTAYKKVIDGGIFVEPRRVAIELPEVWYDDEGNDITPENLDDLPVIQRRILRSGQTGSETALASSEIIPAGSTMKFAIRFTNPKNRDLIFEWLNYGTEHGLGAWRNSGKGVFQWRLLNDDWSPMK